MQAAVALSEVGQLEAGPTLRARHLHGMAIGLRERHDPSNMNGFAPKTAINDHYGQIVTGIMCTNITDTDRQEPIMPRSHCVGRFSLR